MGLNRYEVRVRTPGSSQENRAIIDALDLADLERKMVEMKIQWTSIRLYVSMFRATPD